jgi:hypothetical protein
VTFAKPGNYKIYTMEKDTITSGNEALHIESVGRVIPEPDIESEKNTVNELVLIPQPTQDPNDPLVCL